MTQYKFDEVLGLYYDTGYSKINRLWALIANSHRIINGVYIFKHFDEYCKQLNSDKQEDKRDVYWNASYYEKLIDYIKIVVAFETLNKVLLVKKGILIHQIDGNFDRRLQKKQQRGQPIKLEEFYANNFTKIDLTRRRIELNGLVANMSTINFAHTLNDNYQLILKQDEQLIYYLKEINLKRNKLHFYSDFKGAFIVKDHIDKWKFIKDKSLEIIENEMKKIDQELNAF